ncbi:GWxTD domain-containing protein [candidate division GN15 bacterium]|nr:GWxTD domain-containing protein [candidate division GN15 bacterium]
MYFSKPASSRHRTVLLSCAFIVMAVLLTSNSTATAQDEDALGVYASGIVYNNPVYDSVAIVEFPFGVNRSQFEFFQPDSSDTAWYGRVFAQVDLYDPEGWVIDSANTYFSLRVEDRLQAEVEDYMIFDKLVLTAKPGTYSARVTVIDAVSKREGDYFISDVTVKPAPREKLAIAGAQTAFGITYVGPDYDGPNRRLLRNGYLVIPNPTGTYTDVDSVLYVYGEVYNLTWDPDEKTQWQITFEALGDDGVFYQNYGGRVMETPGANAAIAQSLDVSSWPSGGYKIRIVAMDLQTRESDTALLPVRIVTRQFVEYARTPKSALNPWDTLSIEQKVEVSYWSLGEEQREILQRLNAEGKRSFLKQFWAENDRDPATAVIENRAEAMQLWQYANKMFSNNAAKDNGWSTDRGRVLMTYGMYDEIDDKQAPRTGDPYQVWYYHDIREGKYFVFEDWSGSYDFRLVHSNVYGEIYSQAWEDLIKSGFTEFEGE